MSQRAYTPGNANSPFGSNNANPQSSNYAAISGYSAQELIYIEKTVSKAIFDAAPEQYAALQILFAKQAETVPTPEFEYLEKTFGRSSLESTAVVAPQAAVVGSPQTQVIAMTAASVTHVTPDAIIAYPDNTKAVVKSIAGLNVTVESHTSAGLPAVAVGDIFAIVGYVQADGMDYISNYERLETITRYNFIQEFIRARRWTRMELAMYQNAGRTDYLVSDKDEVMRQFRTDLYNTYWNGERGEIRISNNYVTKTMGGIFPSMVAAGSMNTTTTLAGLKTAFQTLAFKTNFKQEGKTRFIYGTQEKLHDLATVYKEAGTRYAPNDMIANLGLTQYKFGGMNFVPVPCELWRDRSCFPKDWENRLIILDQESITPVKMKGLPFLGVGGTLDRQANGTRENFKDWYIEANLSTKFNNPLGSFYVNLS